MGNVGRRVDENGVRTGMNAGAIISLRKANGVVQILNSDKTYGRVKLMA